jgi:Fur family ferric uptake transcriptional regulator
MTARHDAVRQALSAVGTFISAQDLHAQLRSAGYRIGLTTVYRALAAMSQDGEADVLTADGQQVYRACGTAEHHHHLVCRFCGKTVEVCGPAVERWAAAIGGQHGFMDVTHAIEVFGTCADCASQPSSTTLPDSTRAPVRSRLATGKAATSSGSAGATSPEPRPK